MKYPAHSPKQKKLPFPDCATNCAAIGYLGAGECENVCPWKFDAKGNPKKQIKEATPC